MVATKLLTTPKKEFTKSLHKKIENHKHIINGKPNVQIFLFHKP
jgi:hypothetical protein